VLRLRGGMQIFVKTLSIAMLLIALGLFLANILDNTQTYIVITVGLGLWGAYTGAYLSPLSAIYADSVETGSRSELETYRFIIAIVASSSGPLVNIVTYAVLGNVWSLHHMTIVFVVGVALSLVPTVALLFFSDAKALGHESGAHQVIVRKAPAINDNDGLSETDPLLPGHEEKSLSIKEPVTDQAESNFLEEDDSMLTSLLDGAAKPMADMRKESPLSDGGEGITKMCDMDEDVMTVEHKSYFGLSAKHIPLIVTVTDCVYGLASGMTIKFFPLFFENELLFGPIFVNAIYAAVPLCMAIMSYLAQKLSKSFGRVQTSVLTHALGIGLLTMMAVTKSWWVQYRYVLLVVYLIRTGLMNCTSPLMRSILMDYVDKKARGKWTSFESISSFGWSGSAVAGGIMVDHFGYGFTFAITAAVQFSGWCLTLLLLPIVPRKERLRTVLIDTTLE